ncbi:MAG: roadblock/LC7 domain-containing protein [Candidatus Asgardarchaeia archaeon]
MMNMADNPLYKELQNIMNEANRMFPDAQIDGLVLATEDGIIISHTLSAEIATEEDIPNIAAAAAVLYKLGNDTVNDMEKGDLEGVFVHGDEGYILIGRVGVAILMILAKKEAKTGVLLHVLNKAKSRLEGKI